MLTTVEYLEIKNGLLKELKNSNISEDRRQVIMETLEAINAAIGVESVA